MVSGPGRHLLAGIEFIDPVRGPRDLTNELHRFPVEVAGPRKGARLPATGFAVLAPATAISIPLLQPRFRLRLKSGSYHPLVPTLQPADPVEARASALRAVPPHHVDDLVQANVLSPVIDSLHLQARRRFGEPIVHAIGEPVAVRRSRLSFRSTGHWISSVPDRGLWNRFVVSGQCRAGSTFRIPRNRPRRSSICSTASTSFMAFRSRSVVMERNGGYVRANNAGVSQARGRYARTGQLRHHPNRQWLARAMTVTA